MLEGLVAWVLRTYIGEYVENLNTDKLSIGIYQGQVELENLPLRKDALKNLDLPIEVKSGFIGKVNLAIPWSRLNSAPWVITLEKLFLVAGPLLNNTYNEDEEKKAEQQRKKQQLDALEEKWKVQKNMSPQGSSWWSYGTSSVVSAVTNIVENLQLHVKNVHIRYEDDTTIPGCSFAGGMVIKSLSAHSTDPNWIRQFVSRLKTDLMHKLVDLQNFALYWDDHVKLVGDTPLTDLEDVLSRNMYEDTVSGQFVEHKYILEPVSAQAKMKRNTSELPLRGQATPRISMDIQLDKIPFELRESQYRGLVAWLREFERFEKSRKYRRWKPTEKVKNNAPAWWNFCISATLHRVHERRSRATKEYLITRAKHNVLYVDAYEQHIAKGSYMDSTLAVHMRMCEEEWTFEETKLLREVALQRIETRERKAQEALQESAVPASSKGHSSPQEQQPQQAGLLRRWLPGWGGWSGQSSTVEQPQTSSSKEWQQPESNTEDSAVNTEKQIEQEILDVLGDSSENNTFLKRDTMFAKINFCLESAVVRLFSDTADQVEAVPLLELVCSAIQLQFESRPRSSGVKFGVSVGALLLKDKFTKDSLMPVLVGPQMHTKENQSRQFLSGQLGSAVGRSSFQPLFSGNQTTEQTKSTLFQLIYEKKPFHSKADYKLEIKSKPLDIVYNPAAMKRIQQFFRSSQPGPIIPSTASSRYEELKRTTQAEFQQALTRFLEGDEQVKAKRWDFDMDIAAPQVILPESFTDSSKTLVVLDLGRFQFYNSSAQITDIDQREISEEDEYFVTPSSTPPSEMHQFGMDDVTPVPHSDPQSPHHNAVPKIEEVLVDTSESVVRDKIYDKYTLTLSDLQVMIGTARDNWKHAQTKGSSKLHLVDKFSISLRLERRLLYTTDPQWPKLTLAGSVQSLMLHVSEHKVNALNTYLTLLKESRDSDSEEAGKGSLGERADQGKTDFNATMFSSVYPGKSPLHLSEKMAAHQKKVRQNMADSRLMLMQFSINSVSLEVQSRGRSVAELQVSGVRANYTRRPFDTSLSFTVHSLLVVDAIQTFGTDYELLVASHKSLWIDSMSGSIRDSDPNSPTSPMSPISPRSPRSQPGSPAEMARAMPTSKGSFQAMGATVVSALQSLVTSTPGREESKLPEAESRGLPAHRPISLDIDSCASFPLTLDTEALIKIELDIITPQCPTNSTNQDTLHIANVQFNNLDFVANQETITELLSFVQRLFPSNVGTSKQNKPSASKSATSQKLLSKVEESSQVHWEFNADFHRLNVLLMRAEDQKASKVATVTMSNAKVKATLVGDLEVEGSLDGLQALNLTPEGKKHQKLFSLGIDPTMSSAIHLDMMDFPKPDMYKTANESTIFETETFERALKFSFSKPGVSLGSPVGTPTGKKGFSPATTPSDTAFVGCVNTSREMVLVIRMASLNYTHSPTFMKEVSLCLSDFQEYMAGVGDSIKTVATEVAMGLVQSHMDMGTSMYTSHMDTPKKSKLPVVEESQESADVLTDSLQSGSASSSLKLDALFQTPVIILPMNPESSEVLVGHLGRISVKNYVNELDEMNQSVNTAEDLNRRDQMFVSIKELTVFSVDIDQQEITVKNKELLNKSMFSTPIPGGKKKLIYGTPIVHNTMIELTMQKLDSIEESLASESMDFPMEDLSTEEPSTSSRLDITGRVVNELKVALSKNVFEQILQTLDNIALPEDVVMESSSSRDLGKSSDDLHPSLSGFKLEESSSRASFSTSRASEMSFAQKSPPLTLNAHFELPSLVVEMTGDVGEGEQGLVDIKLQHFKVGMVKTDPFVKDIEVFLQSLVVEDLLIDPKSKHRQLMVSHSAIDGTMKWGDLGVSQYLSSSCPTSVIELPQLDMPPSLPSSLNKENVWDNVYDAQLHRGVTGRDLSAGVAAASAGLHRSRLKQGSCPSTPPPSVSHTPKHKASQSSVGPTEGERLMHIKVKLVDKKSPIFVSKYNKTQRYIDVAFNKLETTLNLQTWVVILDFLGMGAKAHDPEQFTQEAQLNRNRHPSQKQVFKGKEEVNSEVNLKIQSLTLILNKPEYELAKANIAKFGAHVSLREGNFTAQGQLGSMSLLDISPYGTKYRERFITTGTQALDFHLHKYGTPDPDLLREFDVSLKLCMSSVCYVHTHRFVQELIAFTQNFNQLQDLLGQMRAATENRKFQDKAFRSARIQMDIEAGAPIMLIPHSSKDTDVLVMDLGNLTVHNKFIWAGSPGTIAYKESSGRQRCESSGRRDSASTVRDRSGTTDTLTEDIANTTGILSSDVRLESPLDPMTQSTFGSLDEDLRSDAFHTTYESSPEDEHVPKKQKLAATDPLISPRANRVRSSSLSGFYEAMGKEVTNTSLDVSESTFAEDSATSSRAKPGYQAMHSVDSDHSFDPASHICLLDVMEVELSDIDLFSGEWLPRTDGDTSVGKSGTKLLFHTYLIERDQGKVLKEKGRLSLQVERNLEGDISHAEPDISVSGGLSSVHFSMDTKQYKLVKGLLFHNFGEPLEPFQKKVITHFENPKINTVLSGNVWKVICMRIELENVSTELLISHADQQEVSLGCIDFLQSTLTFDRNSDFSKEIGLVSHQIRASDTRYRDAPANVKPNVFDKILQPSRDPKIQNALQLEVHYRSSKTGSQLIVLLNNMRLMGVFDWLLAVKDYLTTPVEDPWKDVELELAASTHPLAEHQASKMSVNSSMGIATKRFSSVDEPQEPPFSFNLNITDTDLVVMEDTADRDTFAVILKSTAIMSYKAQHKEKPLTCNLQSLEVFSCSLSAEDETALSIIDPMQVTLELNSSPLVQHKTLHNTGVNEARQAEKPPILEVQLTSLNIRLSYNDMKLFLAIINSMPNQLLKAQEQTRPKNLPHQSFSASQVEKLELLGFSTSDCEQALEATEGRLDDSAIWLSEHATPLSHQSESPELPVSGIEIRSSTVSLCLIDDCLDADIPLVEVNVSNLHLLHKLDVHHQGKATFRLNGDYYNRSLSGWEPFLETWGCQLSWRQNVPGEENKMAVEVRGNDVLNLNLTHVLMEQYTQTQSKWTEEYFKDGSSAEKISRHRTPFVPFAIRNNSGCNLAFATQTTSPRRISLSGMPDSVSSSHKEVGEWRTVRPGDQLPFLMEEREKIRHKHTHELKVHQVVVAVEGWEAVAPVSLDKVGTYFREAVPKVDPLDPVYREMPPVRVVFDVTLEGSARKVITVRSALMIHNQLEHDVELAVEISEQHHRKKPVFCLPAKGRQPVPMPYVHSKMWCRPTNWSLDWCNKPILWTHVRKAGQVNDSIRSCDTEGGEKNTYRFCVSVYRQHFPMKVSVTGTSLHGIFYDQPGHVITLVPPLRIENLLPIDLNFYLKGTGIRSRVSPGDTASVVAADLSNVLELGVNLENFLDCRELVVPPDTQDYRVKLRIYDERKRTLELWVRILAGLGGSLKFSISAPYWLVNRTGLPLIFRQDSTDMAAGQFEEHEVARSVTPLLFCYADKESREKCSMRLGKLWVGEVKGRPLWCHRFSLERGCGVRPVHVKASDQRPDWVFNIGIDVRQGRGRYCDTNIVTFSPRYQLDNRSSYKLHFAQRHIAQRGQGISGDFTSALPHCTVSFHWPRVDKDQLLCVRIDPSLKQTTNETQVTSCEWSGGFRVDHVNSFHVNMRGALNVCQFLRVDIVLHGATFYVVFSDAHLMPPPYRIDNFSEVAVTYFQTEATDENLRTTLRPNVSIPYAWDESTLPPHITLRVQGGSSATYNMDVVRDGDQLCYENFIYIAFTGTFKGGGVESGQMYMSHMCPPAATSPGAVGSSRSLGDTHRSWTGTFSDFVNSQELVLEVLPSTSKVVLRKKESGNRLQLWRMTSTGLLKHEGTSAPRDPRRHSIFDSSSSTAMVSYVLDVQDIALQPGRETNLMVRKPDERRRTTQMWQFTEDGRLCPMSSTHLCVQSKEGLYGLRESSEVILGPSPPVMKCKDVPMEMQVSRQRMRPGSGLLSVKVITDGPTRVLQITDIKYQQYKDESFQDDWILVQESKRKPVLNAMNPHFPPAKRQDLEVNFHLPSGLGISFVNKVPEELIYISLKDITLSYTSSFSGEIVDFSVKSLQIDNQLFGTTRPILLYVTPSKYDPDADNQPALQISAHKVPNSKWHAHIFRHLLVSMKSLTLVIEEKLLWKLAKFFGVGQSDTADIGNLEESSYDSQRALTAATSAQFARYYFGTLKIQLGQVNLSMMSASELSPDLVEIKKYMRLPLVNFDEAKVELDPFVSVHMFETSALLLESIRIHYTEELKSQAAKILGSVDFLGNPLGLFNDVTEGLSGLLTEGNVGGLVKNVTHGAFNTAAKVTGTVGDGLSYLSGDDSHQRKRLKIKDTHSGSSTGHMKAAFKGLGIGVVGGLTSIFTQSYAGAKNEGIEGLLTGTIKGVVGTVTKPVAGVLDFASETASAVRDTSKGSSRKQPCRVRRPRCSYGPGGLLPAYSEHHAKAQHYLFMLNRNCYTEMFIALEQLRTSQKDSLQALISSNNVYFLSDNQSSSERIMLKVNYSELFSCRCIPKDTKYYIELTMKDEAEFGSSSSDPKKRPLVRCDSESIAQMVVQQINYAKTLHEEKMNTLPEGSDQKKSRTGNS